MKSPKAKEMPIYNAPNPMNLDNTGSRVDRGGGHYSKRIYNRVNGAAYNITHRQQNTGNDDVVCQVFVINMQSLSTINPEDFISHKQDENPGTKSRQDFYNS